MQSAGFLSYAHFDDQHDDGLVSQLALRIAAEVQAQSGLGFQLFVDRKDIKWGQAWKERLDQSLDATTFFMPILTPSYFRSDYCLAEARRFLERERQLGRTDLILPIYYIHVNETPSSASDVEAALMKHQYLDWRELRFELLTSPEIRKLIASAASNIFTTLQTATSFSEEPVAFSEKILSDISNSKGKTSSVSNVPLFLVPDRGEEPDTITVDPHDNSCFSSISAALKYANAGMRILVRPGVYYETLSLNKPVELIGTAENPKDVIVHGSNAPAISIQASLSRIANISFYQSSNDPEASQPAAVITQGRPDIYNCNFKSTVGSGLIISNADPVIRNSTIHNSKSFGIVFKSQSRGTLEDCDIYENGLANIFIQERSNPMVRRNTIHHSYQSGVYVCDDGLGLIENNDIYNNSHAGLATSDGGSPIVRSNRITRSLHYGGIYVFRGGSGVFEYNDIRDNPHGGFQITEKCKPNIRFTGNQE
jgi:parallel beta-helix repeat protein